MRLGTEQLSKTITIIPTTAREPVRHKSGPSGLATCSWPPFPFSSLVTPPHPLCVIALIANVQFIQKKTRTIKQEKTVPQCVCVFLLCENSPPSSCPKQSYFGRRFSGEAAGCACRPIPNACRFSQRPPQTRSPFRPRF